MARERQISRLYVVGSNDLTAPVIEASYLRLLDILTVPSPLPMGLTNLHALEISTHIQYPMTTIVIPPLDSCTDLRHVTVRRFHDERLCFGEISPDVQIHTPGHSNPLKRSRETRARELVRCVV